MSPARKYMTYALAYLLWALGICLAAVLIYYARETLLLALVAASMDPGLSESDQFYQNLRVGAVANWSWLVAGVIFIPIIVLLEGYYRTGVDQGRLGERVSLVMAILLGLFFVVSLAYLLLQSQVSPVMGVAYLVPAAMALVAGVFAGLWYHLRQRADQAEPPLNIR
jgi:Na+-driven multidrug efflux pump